QRKKSCHPVANRLCQLLVREKRHHHVALVVPGPRRRRNQRRDGETDATNFRARKESSGNRTRRQVRLCGHIAHNDERSTVERFTTISPEHDVTVTALVPSPPRTSSRRCSDDPMLNRL